VSATSTGRHALIVATASYSDSRLQQLRAPAADAEALADVLRDPERGDFEVEVGVNKTHGELTRMIARFFGDRSPRDLLLLHFSCHGVKDEDGELYLAAADTDLDLLSATGISAAWLNDRINRTRSRRTVVLLDCCFSGSFPSGLRRRGDGMDAPQRLEGRGRAIITASNAMEYAYEGDELKGEGRPSVFTEAVVEGLRTGEADLAHPTRPRASRAIWRGRCTWRGARINVRSRPRGWIPTCSHGPRTATPGSERARFRSLESYWRRATLRSRWRLARPCYE
jgi:uncharacterized caspase-like protein